MAFNFNWSPLMADTSKAREMLTAALNKSPKPPIIVDDIIVTELNLGSTPPELDILEVGDLAEDKFRGIFKMSYTGDAFLTLKTRVQANPLNTYLTEKPQFASPQPLAAASGLTIPLQITLSDIRLSGFVILVFSRQKGLTIVFRNDPLESLKVSSTFDSIPFVRDYLQKEIEGQLRVLFMEDLPAILHRLSLRLWSSDYNELDDASATGGSKSDTAPVDPLASINGDAVDAFGNSVDDEDSDFPFSDNDDFHATFSAKNLLRLAALTESQKTLSLFTPSIRDAVFRAWAGNSDRHDRSGARGPLTLKSLSQMQPGHDATSSTPSVDDGSDNGTIPSRNSWSSTGSSYQNLGIGNGKSRAYPSRKAKKRVIDLRRNQAGTNTEESEALTPTESDVAERRDAENISKAPYEDLPSPPHTPTKASTRLRNRKEALEAEESDLTPIREEKSPMRLATRPNSSRSSPQKSNKSPPLEGQPSSTTSKKTQKSAARRPILRTVSLDKMPFPHSGPTSPPQPFSQPHALYSPFVPYSPAEQASAAGSSGGILEQAWMMKMAKEIARKVAEEKERSAMSAKRERAKEPHASRTEDPKPREQFWEGEEDEVDAPPAYVA